MLFVKLLSIGIALLGCWFTISQVFIPIIKDLPLFPMFRDNKLSELENKKAEINEDLIEKKLSKEVETLEKKLKGK